MSSPHNDNNNNQASSFSSSVSSSSSSSSSNHWKSNRAKLLCGRSIYRRLRDSGLSCDREFWFTWFLPRLWRVLFAVVAIADMATCWPVLVQGWSVAGDKETITTPPPTTEESTRDSRNHILWDSSFFSWHGSGSSNDASNDNDAAATITNATCSNDFSGDTTATCTSLSYSISDALFLTGRGIGILFCFLCLIEAIIRAREAQHMAMETAALDQFEKRLTRAYSSTRMSFVGSFAITYQHGLQRDSMIRCAADPSCQMDQFMARSTLRTWIPVAFVLIFWCALVIPVNYASESQCGNDQALATFWITAAMTYGTQLSERLLEQVSSLVWCWALPYRIHQPKRLVQRVRQLLRWLRYLRFAGPFVRMTLKLWDQLWSLTKTWRQAITAHAEKAKRLARPSMLVQDLKRVESLAKVPTALAALPSQLVHLMQQELSGGGGAGRGGPSASLTGSAGRIVQKQQQGQKIRRQLQLLKKDILRRSTKSFASVADTYDRVVKLTQELKVTLNNTLLSSHSYLISPHSRFGVVWRITVTNCLLLEIFRLTMSWQLTGTFQVSLRQVISKLFIECDPSQAKQQEGFLFSFIANPAQAAHKYAADMLPFVLTPPPVEDILCPPASASSKLILELVGGALESFRDMVGFLDIFIWFYTGELDLHGVVVPKPFFTRCILPGTLSQVLDHPTLPQVLPALLGHAASAAGAAGWSRVIRWFLAVIPAVRLLLVEPLESYFFDTVDTDKGMMRYAETYGVLAPARPSTANMIVVGPPLTGAGQPPTTPRTPTAIMPKAKSQVGFTVPNLETTTKAANDKNNMILPSPRPLWGGRQTLEEDALFMNDDSYCFDYTALQY